ncbi:mixed polyketide synthase/non-ribosomal peptide synthetase [Paenibacillus sp. LC231]|nr:mixed polyketide synthase/non-ribosomal peptide synthetase [Paenibacillus sp. LC231]
MRNQDTLSSSKRSVSAHAVQLFTPIYKESETMNGDHPPSYVRHLAIFCEMDHLPFESLQSMLTGMECLMLQSPPSLEINQRFQSYAQQLLDLVKKIMEQKVNGKVLIQLVVPVQGEMKLFTGLYGLLRTAHMENPKLCGQLIEVEPDAEPSKLVQRLNQSKGAEVDSIRFNQGKRWEAAWNEVIVPPGEASISWKDNGVYLITGGAGGLGLLFAEDIIRRVKAPVLILTGRSGLSMDKEARLHELRAEGARIEYKQTDVSLKDQVEPLIHDILKEFGSLHGIIHGAGVVCDNFILKKTGDELEQVLNPKVSGTAYLDSVTKDLPLDFFIFFSSIAGCFGNPGQADYAAGNAFMDAYAEYRNGLAAFGLRQGHALSINWPYWKDGGMEVDEITEKSMMQSWGMTALDTKSGILAMHQALASGHDRVLILSGEVDKIRERLLPGPTPKSPASEPTKRHQVDEGLLRDRTGRQLKVLFGEVTRLEVTQLSVNEPLERYGIDSIMINQLNAKMEGIFGELSKTLFYEYQTLGEVLDYLIAEHTERCVSWTGLGEQRDEGSAGPSVDSRSSEPFPVLVSFRKEKNRSTRSPIRQPEHKSREPIAIIGISGRYPSARNLNEYWENLKAGRDCITEIPDDRWPMEDFFDPDPQEAAAKGKSYSKWGGFLEGFADFDPLFFNISPREAMMMDPQERLFIESCWEALEDAGYTRELLAIKHNRRVGVFAGITKTGYDLYGPGLWEQGEHVNPYTSFSSVANRVSYYLNLQGPSMPIDTMCSSSLTAIHEACEHLHLGECEMAIAGGVNLYLHPSNYHWLSVQQMLSKDGRCKSFGQGANGFVPGEGVGIVLLKPLSRAIADEDQIHAVIRSTSTNHGGKTNGYTVPNPVAQGELVRAALDKAGINARAISYIEAHGTGTDLGDPIEITGLTQAFSKDTRDTGFCSIGSAKSNIGHLEAAAGMAGLTKIVLQMKHKMLVPSLHAQELNPNINFANTPFVVQQTLQEWQKPMIHMDGERVEFPRIAGVSSFGAGGSNAHVILEEYTPEETYRRATSSQDGLPVVIPLSAKNQPCLIERVKQLLEIMAKENVSDRQLLDMAYTLQVGREAMEERIAVVAESIQDLQAKLTRYVTGHNDMDGLYRGQMKPGKEQQRIEEADSSMEKLVLERNFHGIAMIWVQGLPVDWNILYRNGVKPRRRSLPVYPFARERYYIAEKQLNHEGVVSSTRKSIEGTADANESVRMEMDGSSMETNHAASHRRAVSGKGRRREMRDMSTKQCIEWDLKEQIGLLLQIQQGRLDSEINLADFGFDSISLTHLAAMLSKHYGVELTPSVFFSHSTISKVTEYMMKEHQEALAEFYYEADEHRPAKIVPKASPIAQLKVKLSSNLSSDAHEPIAVIGMSGRFPQARNVEEMWTILTEGRNAVREIPADRFDWRHYYSASGKAPHKTDSKWCGCIPGVSEFDPLFFEISPKDAESMDPRQRLLLEEAWKALEHAGYGDKKIRAGKIGMFVGAEQGDYQQLVRGEAGITSNHNAILAARLSYFLNLNGPVLTVDTACSSGLAAAHQACLSLRNDECDTAMAAGVNLMLTPDPYVGMSQAGMLSKDGTCFAFDKRANGLVPGEAVTVVVLKRLSRAEADGDSILAVIRGSSMNYDGKTNGITAPSGVAQTELVKAVYEQSRVNPEDVEYVVTHGTGTRLGDPVEVNALQDAFKAYTDKQGYCAITSNKTNFGHTFAASGLVNMINLIQAFRHETIPASLNFEQENDFIHWTESPFYVNTTNKPWPASGNKKRLGAVSAFGMSGTNVHMVLESYVSASVEEPAGIAPYHLLTFSAKSKEVLEEKIQDMVVMLEKAEVSQESLSRISYTLLEGRQHFNHRMAVVVRDKQDAEYILSANGDNIRLPNRCAGKVPRDFEGQVLIQQYVNDLLRSAQSLKEDPDKYRETLNALADLYCQGYEISGDDLYDSALAQLIELPTYPFAREHYWVSVQDMTTGVPEPKPGRFRIVNRPQREAHYGHSMGQDQLRITESAAPQEGYELLTFEEVWEEEALKDIQNANMKTLVCFLTEEESKQIVTDKATALGGDTQVIFVSRSTVFDKKSRHDYSIPAATRDSYLQALLSIRNDFKEIDAVLYLWPIEDAAYIKDYSSIVHMVQAIAAAKLKPKQLLLAGQFANSIERCYMESWIGFERSLGLVLPNVSVSVVSIDLQAREQTESLLVPIGKLWAELRANPSGSVLYQDGKRYICRVKPTVLEDNSITLKQGRTYLITGGCGGLGLLFARHIASRYAANLILTGRSPMNDEIRAAIKELEDLGSQVLYVQSDICHVESMRKGLIAAKARFGPIHGVIHAAGMSSRQHILEKELDDFHKVLAPKVEGTLALDEILQEEQQLDFICYFSSTSAVIGDFGSCDYAIGNRYQMAYARHRNEQNRAGRSIVINWPLWKEGGMGFQDQDNTEMYLKSSGQRLLETEEGLQVFERILSHSLSHHLVLVGQRSRVHRFLGLANNEESLAAKRQTPNNVNANAAPGRGWRNEMKGLSLAQCLEWDMKEMISQLLKIPRDKLDLDENLAEFGFDSINLAQFATVLTEHYGLEITPSLFFGQSTIGKLIDYFMEEHNEMTTEFYRESQISDMKPPNFPDTTAAEPKAFKRVRVQERMASSSSNLHEPIAIIGMSGRFPEARNIDEMWTILAEGQSAVSEVPAERFDWRRYYGDSEQEAEPIYCKWCGTIPGVREFDPMFFEISPNEAKTMDPRQRLLLQESWRALEDAGYGEDKLGGCKIGMFVGVEDGDYHLLVKDKGNITSNHNAILAARLSYFLNLSGPNMAINTACSSGLVAAHQACMSLRNGECDTAIVAGVNLLLTPNAYAGISQAGILSADGKCYAFDQRANGTVPGEAVAALVFKRLSQAEADGDPIHAVIRGSGVNYDGRTNGITAPSGIAQTNLLKEVYHQYQINPAEIEYIVTHGTGTKLGDPVEINALNEAFKAHTEKQGYCALTSSKTNFGHTFAASGLVSLINLVMSMRHETIPPSLNFEQENDYIRWAESPFYVNKKAKAWGQVNGASLKGAVSAFGMSGTNAHMVVESYSRKKVAESTERPPYYILALSAKTKEALEEKIRDMLHALVNEKWDEEDLQHISYTLLNGRVHFSHRCAVVIQDLGDAVYVMKQAGNSEKVPNLFEGRIPRDFVGQKAMQSYIQELLAKSRSQHHSRSQYQETLYALADFYCQGYEIEWGQLFGQTRPYKVKLPAYPFERGSYWVNTVEADIGEQTIRRVDDTEPHPAAEVEVSPLVGRIYDGEIKANVEVPHHSAEMDSEALVSSVSAQLRTLLMEVTGIPHDKLENAASFEELGLDSLMIHALNKKIELWIGQLDATLFYTYNSIQALAAYLAQEYHEMVYKQVEMSVNGASLKNLKQVEQVEPAPKQSLQASNSAAIPSSRTIILTDRQPNASNDIAIIGLAGRYPKADTLQQFWNNLYAGKDSIEEIPSSRWSLDGFYEPDRIKAVAKGLSYSKWGGFLDRVEYFDPLFFNISPRDAMYMDPQERLFLEAAWACMENAGYTRESLKQEGYGNQIGVFVGATFNNYQLFMADAAGQANREMYLATSQMFSIANRVSYIMDFTGPSMTVDTACSSSLYAVHLACESIRNGQSRMAIAGGVNLSLHPSKYITLCQGQFSASDGRCRAFGEGGTGYVPSEAVGAVFMKPLQEAIRDQDSIYGVIKGTAVSHAGRTNGYTVPSPVSQSQAIEKALIQSGIDPRSISSIEAHGTGTSLGDPIEIKGLTDVFGKYTGDTGYCSISSVKSNIGHAEAAAGIAQLTKVLLQLKHQTLVKNVMHGHELNPNIDFDRTPFVVQRDTAHWKRPIIDGQEVPRRSGISSFGAGGANAHIIVEEYVPVNDQRARIAVSSQSPALILLSAKNEDRLREQARQLLYALTEEQFSDAALPDIAYTLQVGREAMEERLAWIVGSMDDLKLKLEGFIEGPGHIKDMFRGQVKRNKETLSVFEADEEFQEAVVKWIQRGKYAKLLNLWVRGLGVDWNQIYGGVKPCRIGLPTYPFAGEPYWIPETEKDAEATKSAGDPAISVIHPLLHRNISDLSGLRFSSVFTGNEFFLKDHVVKGQRVLPGVAYLEMARTGIEQMAGEALEQGRTGIRLKNVVWARPIVAVDQPVLVHLDLYYEDNGEIAYEVYSEQEAEPVLHSQGSAEVCSLNDHASLDIESLLAECNLDIISSSKIYETYSAMGIHYGPAHQSIQKVYLGSGQALAKLSLPPGVTDAASPFTLHPSLMDSALQATISMMMSSDSAASVSLKPGLPFALQELEIFGKCPSEMWARIRYSAGNKPESKVQKLDIDLCDAKGKVFVKMKEFSTRVLDGEVKSSMVLETPGTLMLEPIWRDQPVARIGSSPEYAKHLVFLCEIGSGMQQSLNDQLSRAHCITLESYQERIEERFITYSARIFEEIQAILRDKPKDKILIQVLSLSQQDQLLLSGISGLLKAAQSENSKLVCQYIEIESIDSDITGVLIENSQYPVDQRIRYRDGQRCVAGWGELHADVMKAAAPWRDRGIYLITGGAGGLGIIFAKEILNKAKEAVLILTGRSSLHEGPHAELDELRALGAKVDYRQVDVTNKQQVTSLIQSLHEEYGRLNGIIHAAGIIRDNLILRKDVEELENVMAPKVRGLVYLDEASKDIQLDLFIAFSSVAGATGNPGQTDYSAANAFMDSYAEYRNALTASRQRHGRMLSINWPLWKEGGMRVDEEVEKIMMKSLGTVPMQTSTGIQALYQGFALGRNQVVVMTGMMSRVKSRMLPAAPTVQHENMPAIVVKSDDTNLPARVETALVQTVSKLLKVKLEDIDMHSELSEYGFDSISLTQFANQLNEEYHLELTPTVFFEYTTLDSFAEYLLAEHRAAFDVTAALTAQQDIFVPKTRGVEEEAGIPLKKSRSRSVRMTVRPESPSSEPEDSDFQSEPIAIVGISGLFPMAKDVDEFWKNIVEGKDCITEIPKERWDWRECLDNPSKDEEQTSLKWGGFIEGVEEFDPLFFGISPREAEMMDPQQRLLLTQVWKAVEDAGISPSKLSQHPTGVFVAAGPGDYMNVTSISQGNPQAMTGVVPSLIPNRISYALNLQGPSEYYETACSSTLVALHRAIRSIYSEECEQAIVGAVNLLISPIGFIGFDAMGYLSPDGKAKSFQSNADGFVRSEGVGAIIIKPLSKAIEDNHLIYAVIKGTGVSHGGKGMSLTSPNAAGMKAAMAQAFKGTGVSPRTISYIEAHGIASPIADGIEVNALKTGYQEIASNVPSSSDSLGESACYISTLKPSLGHGEVASGMASLIKSIQAIRHKLIPGVKRFTSPSQHISLEGSPLRISAEHHEWEPLTDVHGKVLPRRAAINSYGIGGVNAHVILEEYVPVPAGKHQEPSRKPQIVALSAKSTERLEEYARHMLEYAERAPEFSLSDFAYTLQIGREQMESRLAFVASSREELIRGFRHFLKTSQVVPMAKDSHPVIFIGETVNSKSKMDSDAVLTLFADNSLTDIALQWTRGGVFPWETLHDAKEVCRMSLPVYPFERRRCWPDLDGDSARELHAGQVKRAGLPHRLTDITAVMAETDPIVSSRVIDIVSKILGLAPHELSPDLPLDQYGLDSILLMQLLQQLQNQLASAVDLVKLQECRTLLDIITMIESLSKVDGSRIISRQSKSEVPGSWPQFPELILLNNGAQGSPVFWFHGGLGGVEMYQKLAQKSKRPFYGIQAKGWLTDRSPLKGVGSMAAYYAHIIQSVQPNGPYDLGGYSLGGVLAYEVTRQLQELGHMVNSVVMLDSPYGKEFQQGAVSRKTAVLQAVNLALASKNFQEPDQFMQTLIHRNELDLNVQEEELFEQLIKLGNTRGLTKTEDQIMSMIEANIKIQHAYQFDQFSVMPLSAPDAVTCYYFRNKGGLLFGELEPYFSTTEDSSALDHATYWEEWERQFPNLHVMDIDPSNHMVLLSEAKSYETIFAFCEELYSEHGMTKEFLRKFKEKAKELHGVKA